MNRDAIFRLLENEDFKEFVVDKYLGTDIKDIVFNEDLDNKAVIDKLKARQNLRAYFDELINSATITEEEQS